MPTERRIFRLFLDLDSGVTVQIATVASAGQLASLVRPLCDIDSPNFTRLHIELGVELGPPPGEEGRHG